MLPHALPLLLNPIAMIFAKFVDSLVTNVVQLAYSVCRWKNEAATQILGCGTEGGLGIGMIQRKELHSK
jgi:hypothetical protein